MSLLKRVGNNALPFSLVAICIAAFGAYHGSFHGPFVFDDASSIETNPTIRQLWPLTVPLTPPAANVTAQGRPMLNLSLAINYALGGTSVRGYHVFNLLIHTCAGLTLFGVVRRTLRLMSRGAFRDDPRHIAFALVVALLWVVHPLQTESVTYIIQRAESLVGLFYLLALYGFIRGAETTEPTGRRAGSAFLVLSALACLAGMATKEVMVTAPLMVLFFDRTFVAGSFREALRRRLWYYLALAGTWLLLGWLVAQGGGNRGGSVGFGVGIRWWDYWLTQFQAVGHYLRLSFWPHPLVFEYGGFWIREFGEIAVGAVLVFGLLGVTLVGLWRRTAVGFLGAWFFGILAPTSLAPGTTQMIVEHRMYLPLAAVIAFAAAIVLAGLKSRRRLLAAGAIAVAGALVLLTVRRNEDYRSAVTLWTDTTVKRPHNPLAHFMLASAQERAGNLPTALAGYQRTLELKPDFSIGHEHFGELLLKQNRRAEAISHFEAALRLQPDYADAHANLGNAYIAEGRITEGVGHLERAAQLMPDSADVHFNLGNALAAASLPDDAVVEYQAAVRLAPTMAEAHYNLANVLVELRRPAEAIPHYEAAIKARPGYAAAHYNLANTLAASGRQPEAVAHYEAAILARADYPEAHHNLGSALFELGRLAEAARHYEEVLRLAPEFPNVRENLARVRARMNGR